MQKLVIFDFAGTIDSKQELEKNIIESIKNLSGRYNLAIISSTPSSYIKSYLEKRDVLSIFSNILGSELDLSKADRIRSLLKKYNILPKDAVYITDTLGDILEAKKCEAKSIGVTWGLHSKETLEKGNPVAIINDPAKLFNLVNNTLK